MIERKNYRPESFSLIITSRNDIHDEIDQGLVVSSWKISYRSWWHVKVKVSLLLKISIFQNFHLHMEYQRKKRQNILKLYFSFSWCKIQFVIKRKSWLKKFNEDAVQWIFINNLYYNEICSSKASVNQKYYDILSRTHACIR